MSRLEYFAMGFIAGIPFAFIICLLFSIAGDPR